MAKLKAGEQFPPVTLKDTDGVTLDFPAVPSPVALAKAAVSVASGKEPPANYPGKS